MKRRAKLEKNGCLRQGDLGKLEKQQQELDGNTGKKMT